MNITLAVDEQVAEQTRQAASAMGKSLNQAVRDYLEQLAGAEQLASELKTFERIGISNALFSSRNTPPDPPPISRARTQVVVGRGPSPLNTLRRPKGCRP